MPRGDKDKYTDKQKRKAEHIEQSYEDKGFIGPARGGDQAWRASSRTAAGGHDQG